MNYKELIFNVISSEDYHKDLLINALSEIGYDTFEDTAQGFKAYIPSSGFNREKLENVLISYKGVFDPAYEINTIAEKNWNEEWESNFSPLLISGQCYVRATFHEPHPEYRYEIVIDPKMAFGTGHHQTTSLMMEFMLEEDFKNKAVLDMGCGTGILSILASKSGAEHVLAIDCDPLCYSSSLENSHLNNSDNIEVLCGSRELTSGEKFDIILANINRNILLDQLNDYSNILNPGGMLFISGFYENTDLDILIREAKQTKLKYTYHKSREGWAAAKFIAC